MKKKKKTEEEGDDGEEKEYINANYVVNVLKSLQKLKSHFDFF